jgi:type IV secretory pathway VirB10-like protein
MLTKNNDNHPHEFDLESIEADNPDAEIGEKGGKKFDPKIAIFFLFVLLLLGVLYFVFSGSSKSEKADKADSNAKKSALISPQEPPKLIFNEQKTPAPPPAPDIALDLIKKRLLDFTDKDYQTLKAAEETKYQQQNAVVIKRTYGAVAHESISTNTPEELSQFLIKRRSSTSGNVATVIGGQLLGQSGDGAVNHTSAESLPARSMSVKGFSTGVPEPATLPATDKVLSRPTVKRDPAGTPAPTTTGGKLKVEPYHTASLARNIPMNPSFFVPQGTSIRCVMQMAIISDVDGPASCIVPDAVRSFDGVNVLIPKGSQVIGEYKKTDFKDERVPILWARLITPDNIDIALDSPGGTLLGMNNMSGYVDKRWGERLFTATLLSLGIDAFSWKVVDKLPKKRRERVANGVTSYEEVDFDSITVKNGRNFVEGELQRSLATPYRLSILQGTEGSITVAKDLDFSEVYPANKKDLKQ